MSTPTLVAFDTNILVYLTAPPDDANAILSQKAVSLFEELRAQKSDIALPAIVVGEYLAHPSFQNNLSETLGELQTQFVILPFDTKTATIYAHLMHHKGVGAVDERYKAHEGIPRRCLHADIAILATAEAHGVSVLYTGERKPLMPAIARKVGLRLEVKSLYDLPLQNRLF